MDSASCVMGSTKCCCNDAAARIANQPDTHEISAISNKLPPHCCSKRLGLALMRR